jgi:hypothetical protein
MVPLSGIIFIVRHIPWLGYFLEYLTVGLAFCSAFISYQILLREYVIKLNDLDQNKVPELQKKRENIFSQRLSLLYPSILLMFFYLISLIPI